VHKQYRLNELIEALTALQTAPVHPDAVKTGGGQVFIYVREKNNPNPRMVRGEIELKDCGAYVEIGIVI
jgi:hypothetical protein